MTVMPLDRIGNAADGEVNNSLGRLERARESLRTKLISGEFGVGTRLTEGMLSAQLGISRGTRLVLASLANDGYLTLEPNVGAKTRQFDIEEAREILEVRELIEGSLAAMAAKRATEDELFAMAKIVDGMRLASLDADPDAYSELNGQFHTAIANAARQSKLTGVIRSSLHPLVMHQYRKVDADHPSRGSYQVHQTILNAMIMRIPQAAEAAMRHHVSGFNETILANAEF